MSRGSRTFSKGSQQPKPMSPAHRREEKRASSCDLSKHSMDPVPPRTHSPPHPCPSEQSSLQAAAVRQDLTVVHAGATQSGLYFLRGAREGPLRGCGDAEFSLETRPRHWP